MIEDVFSRKWKIKTKSIDAAICTKQIKTKGKINTSFHVSLGQSQ